MLTIREPSFKAVQDIVATKTAAKFRYGSSKNVSIVDLMTASAIVAVYNAGNDVTRAKVERMCKGTFGSFLRLCEFATSKTSPLPNALSNRPASLPISQMVKNAGPAETGLGAALARAVR